MEHSDQSAEIGINSKWICHCWRRNPSSFELHYKESASTISLPEDDPWIVARFIQFLYTNTYDMEYRQSPFVMAGSLRLEDVMGSLSYTTSMSDKEHDLRTLWIDAICINQQDLAEKELQISLMRDIYICYTQTVAWFSDSFDDIRTRDAVELCESIDTQYLNGKEFHELRDMEKVALQPLREKVIFPAGTDLGLLDVVFGNLWFTRLWVWQELVLPAYCVCQIGSFTISWKYVILTADWYLGVCRGSFAYHRPAPTSFNGTQLPMVMVYSQKLAQQEGLHLFHLVLTSLRSQVSEPRDRIFVLLGLTRWAVKGRAIPVGIRPDYNVSLRSCMRNATRVMIEEDGNLEVLCCASSRSQTHPKPLKDQTWPSWTPAWSVVSNDNIRRSLATNLNADNGRAFNVQRLKPTPSGDLDTLVVDGFQVDGLERCERTTWDQLISAAQIRHDVRNLRYRIENHPHCRSLSTEVFLKTLLQQCWSDDPLSETDWGFKEAFDYLSATSDLPISSEEWESDSPLALENLSEEDEISLRRTLEWFCVDRCVFISNDGRLGSGLDSILPGDIIVILFGSRWPMVLRKKDNYYRLVGPCYVDGIMNGEFVREMEEKQIRPKTFWIR